MQLKNINSKYIYKTDNKRFNTSLDIWELPKPNKYDLYEADCESYCRLLRNHVDEFRDWDYYYCRISGVGHCILVKDDQTIDCNSRKVMDLDKYIKAYRVTELKKYNWFVLFSKVAFAKVYTFFNKGE